MTTILDAIRNADYNLQKNGLMGLVIAKEQLHNAAVLLGKGYDIYDTVNPLIEEYGIIENVPEKKIV